MISEKLILSLWRWAKVGLVWSRECPSRADSNICLYAYGCQKWIKELSSSQLLIAKSICSWTCILHTFMKIGWCNYGMTTLRTTLGLKKDHPFPVNFPSEHRVHGIVIVQYFLLFLLTFSKEKQENDLVYAKILRFKYSWWSGNTELNEVYFKSSHIGFATGAHGRLALIQRGYVKRTLLSF